MLATAIASAAGFRAAAATTWLRCGFADVDDGLAGFLGLKQGLCSGTRRYWREGHAGEDGLEGVARDELDVHVLDVDGGEGFGRSGAFTLDLQTR